MQTNGPSPLSVQVEAVAGAVSRLSGDGIRSTVATVLGRYATALEALTVDGRSVDYARGVADAAAFARAVAEAMIK
jgi:hypothetical protein